MKDYQFIKDYKEQEHYRNSFNQLVERTYGFNFEAWYQLGAWNENYQCYSYLAKNEVIANVSINHMQIRYQGESYPMIQIGTVMTHPDYQNQGLIRELIKKIEADYQDKMGGFYLFANEQVLDFYPKFGYKKQIESCYTLNYQSEKKINSSSVEKVDSQNQAHHQLIQRLMADRVSINQTFQILTMEHLEWFYYHTALADAIYYLPSLDSIILASCEAGKLDIFDILTTGKLKLDEFLHEIEQEFTFEKVEFHFMPDEDWMDKIDVTPSVDNDDTLFVKPLQRNWPSQFKFPQISHA